MLCQTSISCLYVAQEPRYDEYRILGAAILNFKMATSSHGDGDGYQVLYESTHVKLRVYQCPCLYQILHDSRDICPLTAVLYCGNPTKYIQLRYYRGVTKGRPCRTSIRLCVVRCCLDDPAISSGPSIIIPKLILTGFYSDYWNSTSTHMLIEISISRVCVWDGVAFF